MKKRSNALFLACMPVLCVLILLGMGLPQRVLPAVTVGNQDYSVVAYNYYYYEAYYAYVTENYAQLAEVGLDLTKQLKNQDYDSETTWAEHFREETLADMQEYTILYGAALAEGFDASEAVAQARADKSEELRAYCVEHNVQKVEHYLTSLYDAGMTEETFYLQLERRTTAEAYRAALLEALAPSQAQVEAYCRENPLPEDYATADVTVCFFRPATDRTSGEVTQRQWDNAETLARAAWDRALEQGGGPEAFRAIALAYSELEDSQTSDGHYAALTREGLDEALEQWCFDSRRTAGDTALLQGESGWYLVYFNGWGADYSEVQARQTLLEQSYQDWLAQRAQNYTVKTHALGMQIAR